MTENEFLKEYVIRFSKIVTDSISTIHENKNLHYDILFAKYFEINGSLSYLGNTLISDIMDDYNLDYNYKVLDNLTLVPVANVLFRKTWGIQLEIRKKFDDESVVILKEARCRDFPKDCHY